MADIFTLDSVTVTAHVFNIIELSKTVGGSKADEIIAKREFDNGYFTIELNPNGSGTISAGGQSISYDYRKGFGVGFGASFGTGWQKIKIFCRFQDGAFIISGQARVDAKFASVGSGADIKIDLVEVYKRLKSPYSAAHRLKHRIDSDYANIDNY